MRGWPVFVRVFGIGLLVAMGIFHFPGCNTSAMEKEKVVREISNGQSATSEDPLLVVEYGGRSLAVQEIRDAYGTWDNVQDLKGFRERAVQLAISEAFSRKAIDLGLDRKNFQYMTNIQKFIRESLFKLYVEQVIDPKVVLEQEDYRKALKDQKFTDTVNIRVLLPADPSTVGEIEKEIRQEKDFFSLMEKYGTKTGKRTRGNIGFISLENTFIPEKYRTLVFQAKEGSIVGPVDTYTGTVFILLEEKYTAKEMYELAKKNVEPSLKKQKAERVIHEELSRLRKKYPVKINRPDENEFQFVGGMKVRVAARIADTIITDGELASENDHHRAQGFMDQDRKLARIMSQILFAKEAESIGLDQDPVYRKELHSRQREELFGAYKNHVFQTPVRITTTDLKAYYRDHREEYFKYPEASYAVFRKVGGGEPLKMAMEQAGKLEDKAGIDQFAAGLNVSSEIVIRKRIADLPVAVRQEMGRSTDGDVFEISGDDGTHDIYRVIHLDKEERYPKFEDVRDEVERSYRHEQMMEHLTSYMAGEIGKAKVNEEILKNLYAEYKEAAKRRHVPDRKSKSEDLAPPHSKPFGSDR